jgi:tetratricopeptide (TPR) repeat protein
VPIVTMLELWAVLVYAPAQGGAQAELPRVSAALKQALKASGAEVVDHAIEQAKADAQAGFRPKSALAFFTEARAAIDEGRKALERVALEQAQAAFERAEKTLEAHRAEPGAATLAAAATLGRGVALFELGRGDEATHAFARAKALEPALELTEATVRPDVARAFRAATPESIAPAPASVPDTSAVEALRVRPDSPSLRALEDGLGLDGILVAAVGHDHGELALIATRAHGGCTSGLAESRAAIDQAAARLVEKLRAAPCAEKPLDPLAAQAIAHPRPPPAPVEFRPEPKKLRVWQRPWLWAGLLAGTSLIVGLSAGLAPHGTTTSATLDASRFAH